MDSLNLDSIDSEQDDAVKISFSHFLPRLELLPEKRLLFSPILAKGMGSNYLGDRVSRLKPDLHLFGHSHYGWSTKIDGIQYTQACVAYPRERRDRMMTLTVSSDETSEASKAEDHPRLGHPLLVYDGERKCFPKYHSFWSEYYKTRPRQPSNTAWIYGNLGTLDDVTRGERLDNLVVMQARGNDIIDAQTLEGFIKKARSL